MSDEPIKGACLFLRTRFGQLACVHQKAKPEDLPKACETCSHYAGTSRGVGDVVASAINQHLPTIARAFKNCGGCAKRRAAMNKGMPFKRE